MNKKEEPTYYLDVDSIIVNFITGLHIAMKPVGAITETEKTYSFMAECNKESYYKKTHVIFEKATIASVEIGYAKDINEDYTAPENQSPSEVAYRGSNSSKQKVN